MTAYTTPIRATFEFQRRSIAQGQRALEQAITVQRNVNQAALDGFESTEAAQCRAVEFYQSAIHQSLDAVEANVPGTESAIAELRETVDEQFDALLESHAEVADRIATEFEEGVAAYDDLTEDSLAALDEQIELLVDAHEELEGQSVEAAEQDAEGVEELQEQVEAIQEQAREAGEQVVEA